jgi:hypothetical protein
MGEQQSASPDFDAGHGWRVLDADGNVVASGGISEAKPTLWVSEYLAEASRNEQEQEQWPVSRTA